MVYVTFFGLATEHTRLLAQLHERRQVHDVVRRTSEQHHERIMERSRARISESKALLAKPVHVPANVADDPPGDPMQSGRRAVMGVASGTGSGWSRLVLSRPPGYVRSRI
jgi:hypothetical protein